MNLRILFPVLILAVGLSAPAYAAKSKAATKTEPATAAPAEAAPAADLPDARALLKKYVEVGGYEKLRETKNQAMVGTFAVPAQGLEAAMKGWAAAPNLILVSVNIPGMGEAIEGFDGTRGWSVDPVSGPNLKDGDLAAQAAFDADYFDVLDPTRFVEATTLAREDFHGTAAYKVRLKPRVGAEMTAWYGVESGLELGQETVQPTPMGDIPVATRNLEYREFNGMQFPTRMEQTMMGMTQVISIDSIEFDVDPAPDFAPPQAVQELLEELPAAKPE